MDIPVHARPQNTPIIAQFIKNAPRYFVATMIFPSALDRSRDLHMYLHMCVYVCTNEYILHTDPSHECVHVLIRGH